ncbi:MAG: TonB-dependent siderophore receptor [Leptothrix sp. (in: Bacteria)]|nr:TonB-dependent siderophore receptor [Leptothrix sp. (in: b-proteobacteria)]
MAFRSFVHPTASSRPPAHRASALLTFLLAALPAMAQTTAPAQVITVTGQAGANSASVAGFGDLPLWRLPLSASVINTAQLQDAGIASLADITRLDAGVTDAYNPPGYWSQLAVRGYTLDNRFNYRRDGLPINAETVIVQANKQALEILKGTSGLQAGTSAPGGLVNLVVKRPQRAVRSASLGWEQDGTVGAAVDLGDRLGADGRIGWRLNASATRLDPPMRNARGSRRLLAGAFDVQAAPGSLVEAEFELSRQSQRSTPGFSLLGNRLPDAQAIDPRTNLNNQPWSLPVVMAGSTASVRYTQALTDGIDLVAHAMRQRLRTDDRIAFPFGCSSENNYDRYCSDGSFDIYDFRSEGERRDTDALDLSLAGRATLGGLAHRFKVGVLGTRYQARFNRQAYNYAGTGTLDGLSTVPADPTLTDENTNRDERSTELHLQDMVELHGGLRAWAGLRHSRLQRDSVRTDGSRATAYAQDFTTPWLALSQALGDQGTAYLSWGQAVESEVAPGRARYTNAGQALPALKSRQVEAGYKRAGQTVSWSLAAFDIRRPEWRDIGACDINASCTRRADGQSRRTGVEAEAEWRSGALSLRGSALALRARREGSADGSLNGKRPTNVPPTSLKLQAAYNLAGVPGLALLGYVTHEGERMVLPDNSIATPGWTRLDLAARYSQRLSGGGTALWRAGVDNLADRRAWKEAPFQYGHAYLYPMAPRSLHASVALGF